MTASAEIVAPWTAPWPAEEGGWHIAPESWRGERFLALRQEDAQGRGRPMFRSAHMQRQRRAVLERRCDVCGKPIGRAQAAVVLAEPAMLVGMAATGHVMAPSHRACAAIAARRCPHVRRQLADGALVVSVIVRSRVALATLAPWALEELGLQPPPAPVAGHAKLVPERVLQRDASWLLGAQEGRGAGLIRGEQA